MRSCGLLLLFLCSFPGFGQATEAKLVHGAGTLPQRSWAISLNTGVDYGELIGYTVQGDYGVTDRLQVGLSGGYFFVMGTAGIPVTFNVFRSADDTHHLSVHAAPGYLWFHFFSAELKAFRIDPTLAYEFRFGAARRGGVFAKLGTQHYYGKVGSDLLDTLFDATAANTTRWGHAWKGSAGVQYQTGRHFSLAAEAGAVTRLTFRRAAPIVHLGFTWGF